MIEKEPDSSSDIVERALGELRSSPIPPEMPPALLDALLQAAREKTEAVPGTVEASAQPQIRRPTFPGDSRTKWGWMMRASVSRMAAAAALVFAIAGVLWWFHGSAAPAFADFLQPILEAKTAKYKLTIEVTGTPAAVPGQSAERPEERIQPHSVEVLELGPDRSRQESERPDKSKRVDIWDGRQRKQLVLEPVDKRATLYDYAQDPETKTEAKTATQEDPGSAPPRRRSEEAGQVALFRALLLDTLHKPEAQRESLGEQEIDGRRVVGFRLRVHGAVLSVWGDPQTRLPVRLEATTALTPNLKVTASHFEFNLPLDESLFSVDPPAGYSVVVLQRQPRDDSPEGEKDLIEAFRCYGQWLGGRFPDVLDAMWIDEVLSRARWFDASLPPQKPPAEQEKEADEVRRKMQRGMMFAALLPKDSDWHYAGRGVSLGAADTPVCWYRPKDTTKYRVIYADLAVGESESPPRVSVVPVAQIEKDLIAMFRQCAELSGDGFPDNLEFPEFIQKALWYPPEGLSAAEKQKAAEARARLQQGAIFLGLLPHDADRHYAGKGAWLGAADRPIFWYRPQESSTYRVVYADLSVRDADTPPSLSLVPPEQDLLNALRYYSQLLEGRFPIALNDRAPQRQESSLLMANAKILGEFAIDLDMNAPRPPSAQQTRGMTMLTRNMQPGLDFVAGLPPQSDWHYAGWGVSRGAAERPIFWYRPQDSQKYRVIYADLSVRDANTAPIVPEGPPQQELIDALRFYSQRSAGTFPDALDQKEFFQSGGKKLGQWVGPKIAAKQVQDSMEIMLKLQPGVAFAASLPAEADAHYAGKGVLRGTAGTPIFWYRPKDASKYQVIDAELSVHETDTPPDVSQAHPLPAAGASQ